MPQPPDKETTPPPDPSVVQGTAKPDPSVVQGTATADASAVQGTAEAMLSGRSLLPGVIAFGVIVVIGLLAISIGVLALNRTFDADKLDPAGRNELIAARVDHDAILAVGYSCPAPNDSAPTIKVADHLLTMAADDTTQQPTGSAPPPMALQEPSYMLAAIVMSQHIGWARIALAEEARWTSVSMQIFQWWVVVIGAITTVLISIKAISNERTNSHLAIGIAAIIFSTVGTAVATMNSFYAPRVTHDQDQRSLQALQALHLELATAITREESVCDPLNKGPADWRVKRIKAIAAQYAAVMSATQAPSSAPDSDQPDAAPDKPTGSGAKPPPAADLAASAVAPR
jgi:hypothetical protein